MVKKKIYLFRHGQSTYNKEHRFTGWKDAKLTRKGYEDAKKVANKLKNKRIDLAFCSSLTRSKETLKEVLKYHPECKKIIVDDRIIERNYGLLQGKKHTTYVKEKGEEYFKQLTKKNPSLKLLSKEEKEEYINKIGEAELKAVRRSYAYPPPKGESIKDVEKRVKEFIKDLIKLIKKEKINVAISAHGNSMRPFRKHFEKLSNKEMMKLENPWDDYFEYEIEV